MYAALQDIAHGFAQTASDNPLATGFGMAGFLCLVIWPLFRTRPAMLAAQFGVGIGYCMHYLLLAAWTGASVTALGASQTAFSLAVGRHPRLRVTALGFCPLIAVVVWATWSGVASLFAGLALMLIMLGRLQSDVIRMRVLLLAAAPLGMAYDVLIGSLPGLAGGSLALTISSVMLVRELRRRRAECQRELPAASPATWFRSWRRFVGALGLRRAMGVAAR
jgi:hypothetical protein